MKAVFISNVEITETEINGIEIFESFSFTEKSKSIVRFNTKFRHFFDNNLANIEGGLTDIVYVIDVHCNFMVDGILWKLQQQGGVFLYRYLLHSYNRENIVDKLKVVFYSPISKELLATRKPENFVLKLLPFVQLKFETDEQFAKELSEVIADVIKKVKKSVDGQNFSNGWPQFNSASENLLSGWALAGLKQIETNDKEILFIADQQNEWKASFNLIFKEPCIVYIKNSKGEDISSQKNYRNKVNANWQSFIELVKRHVDNGPDLILSDFYLKENHEINRWKDIAEIKTISGYQLFAALRNYSPATPFVFHTSSNKTAIYKFFDVQGVDDWIVKDIRLEAIPAEKKENFEVFRDSIENFLCGELHKQLMNIWVGIEKISNGNNTFWWSHDYEYLRDDIVSIIKDCWFGIRRASNKEAFFEKSTHSATYLNHDTFTSSAIAISMGKIMELLGFDKFINDLPGHCGIATIITTIRNLASHGRRDLYCMNMQDAIYLLNLSLKLLTIKGHRDNLIKLFPVPLCKLRTQKEFIKYSLFWYYIQLHNSKYLRIHRLDMDLYLIENRLRDILNISKADGEFFKILDTEFPSLKIIDHMVASPDIVEQKSGKYKIVVPA